MKDQKVRDDLNSLENLLMQAAVIRYEVPTSVYDLGKNNLGVGYITLGELQDRIIETNIKLDKLIEYLNIELQTECKEKLPKFIKKGKKKC